MSWRVFVNGRELEQRDFEVVENDGALSMNLAGQCLVGDTSASINFRAKTIHIHGPEDGLLPLRQAVDS